MKKIHFFILALLLSSSAGIAETSQFVFPEKIYVGDSAEVRFVFDSKIDIFSSEDGRTKIELNNDNEIFDYVSKKCLVKEASLEKNAGNYTFTLEIVAWENGYIDFPPFDICSLVRKSLIDFSDNINVIKNFPVIIDLKPVRVDSIVQKTQNHSFYPPVPPMLIPGTMTILTILSIIFVIFIGLLIFVITKINFISGKFENFLLMRALQKNSRKAVKNLSVLLKKSDQVKNDRRFAELVQKILRNFLCVRFRDDFKSLVTSQFTGFFYEISCGEIPDNQVEPVQYLIEIFTRTDFIRFAGNNSECCFQPEEREQIIKKSIATVLGFDENIEVKNDI